jgi:hypothetical protein
VYEAKRKASNPSFLQKLVDELNKMYQYIAGLEKENEAHEMDIYKLCLQVKAMEARLQKYEYMMDIYDVNYCMLSEMQLKDLEYFAKKGLKLERKRKLISKMPQEAGREFNLKLLTAISQC